MIRWIASKLLTFIKTYINQHIALLNESRKELLVSRYEMIWQWLWFLYKEKTGTPLIVSLYGIYYIKINIFLNVLW